MSPIKNENFIWKCICEIFIFKNNLSYKKNSILPQKYAVIFGHSKFHDQARGWSQTLEPSTDSYWIGVQAYPLCERTSNDIFEKFLKYKLLLWADMPVWRFFSNFTYISGVMNMRRTKPVFFRKKRIVTQWKNFFLRSKKWHQKLIKFHVCQIL